MRKTGIDQTITRDDVKVGDKIRITREVTVKSVRPVSLGNVGPSVIIEAQVGGTQERDSLALTRKETVTLLERDQSLEFGDNAQVVTWRVGDGSGFKQRFAVREVGGGSWITDDNDTYSTGESLEGDILDDEFGDYIEGTFEVLFPKPKPKFADGGYTGRNILNPIGISADTVSAIQAAARRGIAPLSTARFS